MSLPNSVNYTEIQPYLKEDVHSTTIVINPVKSKATYSPGDTIIFDYNSEGHLDSLTLSQFILVIWQLQPQTLLTTIF